MTVETLLTLARDTRAINDANGFVPTEPSRLPTVIALIHSELSEAWDEFDAALELDEGNRVWAVTAAPKVAQDKLLEELADTAIRMMDLLTYPFVCENLEEHLPQVVWSANGPHRQHLLSGELMYALLKIHSNLSAALELCRKAKVLEDYKELVKVIRPALGMTLGLGQALSENFGAQNFQFTTAGKLEKNKARGFKHGGKNF